MTAVASLRNFDLIPSLYSIFDYHGEEIGRNYSFEFMGTHDSVIVFYIEDGEFVVESRKGFLLVHLPLKILEDRGTHILTYGVTTFFIGEKRFFAGKEEISKVFSQMKKDFREELEAIETLTPAILSELVENRLSDVDLLSSAYAHMISYAAWWILNIGAQNERWDIKRLAEVLKSFKKPDIEGVAHGAESFLREIDAINPEEYRRGLNSLRRLYTDKAQPEDKKLATEVAFDALTKLYKAYMSNEQ